MNSEMLVKQIDEIRKSIYNTHGRRKGFFATQVDLFRNITLEHRNFPAECLDLIIEILSVDQLFSQGGIYEFIMELYTDMPRLDELQRQQLLSAICENYPRYNDLELCLHIGDLVARCYDKQRALNTFRRLFPISTDHGKEGVALGLDVLRRYSGENLKLQAQIKSILESS